MLATGFFAQIYKVIPIWKHSVIRNDDNRRDRGRLRQINAIRKNGKDTQCISYSKDDHRPLLPRGPFGEGRKRIKQSIRNYDVQSDLPCILAEERPTWRPIDYLTRMGRNKFDIIDSGASVNNTNGDMAGDKFIQFLSDMVGAVKIDGSGGEMKIR